MFRLPSRSILASLALAALPLALGCLHPKTGGFVCKANGRDAIEQEVVYWAMEWAYDKVDYAVCRNQKVLVEVEASTECDIPDIRTCVAQHVQTAGGIVVDREAEATVKLSSSISLVKFRKVEHFPAPDRAFGEFGGSLTVAELTPGGVRQVVKLHGRSSMGY